MITFTVPGNPVPKERPRQGKGRRTYTPPKTRAKENEIAWRCKQAMGSRPPLVGAVQITMEFTLPDRRTRDLDNLIKLVLDGCNRIGYVDDNQVAEIHAVKLFDGEPQTSVTIRPAY